MNYKQFCIQCTLYTQVNIKTYTDKKKKSRGQRTGQQQQQQQQLQNGQYGNQQHGNNSGKKSALDGAAL